MLKNADTRTPISFEAPYEARINEEVVAVVPNDQHSQLRITWVKSQRGAERYFLNIRGILPTMDGGHVPMKGFGLRLSVANLAAFSAAMAKAASELEPDREGRPMRRRA